MGTLDTLSNLKLISLIRESSTQPRVIDEADAELVRRDAASPLTIGTYRAWKLLVRDHYRELTNSLAPEEAEPYLAKLKAVEDDLALADLCMRGLAYDVETQTEYLVVTDRRSLVERLIPTSAISDSRTLATLASFGVVINNDISKKVRKRIDDFRNSLTTEVIGSGKPVAMRPVWWTNPDDGSRRLIFPDKYQYRPSPPSSITDLKEADEYARIARSENEAEWRGLIEDLLDDTESWRTLFLLGAATATSYLTEMVQPLGLLKGTMWHVYGTSSSGKTTVNLLLHKLWHNANVPLTSWDTTVNALMGNLHDHNLAPFCLDEIRRGAGDKEFMGSVLFAIGEGAERSRADVTGRARASRDWSTCVFSTGEFPVESPNGFDGELKRIVNVKAPVMSLKMFAKIAALLPKLHPIGPDMVQRHEDIQAVYEKHLETYTRMAESMHVNPQMRGVVETRCRQFAFAHTGFDLLMRFFGLSSHFNAKVWGQNDLFSELIEEISPKSLAEESWNDFCEFLRRHQHSWLMSNNSAPFVESNRTFLVKRLHHNDYGDMVLMQSSGFTTWIEMRYGHTGHRTNILRSWEERGWKMRGNSGRLLKVNGATYIAFPFEELVRHGVVDSDADKLY